MTTTASKSGLKAAANARTRKHAQTTPLPARSGVIDAVMEEVAALKAAKDPADNGGHLLKKAPRTRKPAAKAPTAKPAEPVALPVPEPPKKAKKGAAAKVAVAEAATGVPTDTKAHRNAPAFTDNGWEVVIQVDGDYVELIAQRANEIIHQAWQNGVYHNDSATYTISDRTVRTRNVSEAKKWAARTPAEAATVLSKVGANTSFVKKAPKADSLERQALPFDPATATELDMWPALTGKNVRWLNRLSNAEESAVVGSNDRFFKIDETPNGRVLQFCSAAQGFRALRLDNLLGIGRARKAATAE